MCILYGSREGNPAAQEKEKASDEKDSAHIVPRCIPSIRFNDWLAQGNLKQNMTKIEQNDGVRDAIIPAFLDVFVRNGNREAEMSNPQFQSKEDLVPAFLKDRHVLWMSRFENEIE